MPWFSGIYQLSIVEATIAAIWSLMGILILREDGVVL